MSDSGSNSGFAFIADDSIPKGQIRIATQEDMAKFEYQSHRIYMKRITALEQKCNELENILNNHGPEGHNCTNQQFVDLLEKNAELEDENKKLRTQVRGFKAGVTRKKNKAVKDSIEK